MSSNSVLASGSARPRRALVERALLRAAQGLDRAIRRGPFYPLGRSRADELDAAERIAALRRIADFYQALPEVFPAPAPIAPDERRRRSFLVGASHEVVDMRWPSGFDPAWPDPVRQTYLEHRENHTARARWFRHRDGGRPVVMLLHGYLGGTLAVEERVWPVRWLLERGLDVVLTVLPRHGSRRARTRVLAAPGFPSSDPRLTAEGLRQVVYEHRGLVTHMLAAGAPAVGVMGMSLGGYVTALLATAEPRLAFAVPFIPLGSISLYAEENQRFIGDAAQQLAQRQGLDAALATVCPLQRQLAIDRERILVVAGEVDGITGLSHARRLADHFQAPLVTFPGGHVLQVGRDEAFQKIDALWRRAQLTR